MRGALSSEIHRLWQEQKIKHDYAGVFERFVREYKGEGLITCQYMARPEGKELQLASWLSRKGHDIEFLTPSNREGDHTPDIRLDGELREIKRITSKNQTKAKSRISEGFQQSDSALSSIFRQTGIQALSKWLQSRCWEIHARSGLW